MIRYAIHLRQMAYLANCSARFISPNVFLMQPNILKRNEFRSIYSIVHVKFDKFIRLTRFAITYVTKGINDFKFKFLKICQIS